MKSGKTEELQRLIHRVDIAGQSHVLVIPKIEKRERDVQLPPGNKNGCVQELPLDVKEYDHNNLVTFIDEAQFFDSLLWTLKFPTTIISALNGTAEQKMWPSIAQIIPYATDILLLTAICDSCGKDATCSYYPAGKSQDILIGDSAYKALCRDCLDKRLVRARGYN
jgi:thymidine kinase